jgi:DNA-binding transcriptional MocR family regulator
LGDLVQKYIHGTTAVKISLDIEDAVRAGHLEPGAKLPTVRDLAKWLNVSPATVASAYATLAARAMVVAHGRGGTRISHRPMPGARRPHVIAENAVNLADGNPDPALLPNVAKLLGKLSYRPHLYGEDPMHAGLIKIMSREMKADGVAVGQCAVVSGAMDGLDRLFTQHLRAGDCVAVEDPGFNGHHDLIASRGLRLIPVRIDAEGMIPDALERACRDDIRAVLITPRVQSPTGAAFTGRRARELQRVLRKRPDALVLEDDHSSFLTGAEYAPVHERTRRWAHLRSFSKAFNPDLRLAVMTGDDQTMTALLDRLVVIERWVSHILQSLVYALLNDAAARSKVSRAQQIYDQRRTALIDALGAMGLKPVGTTGYNIWLPVHEETSIVQGLAKVGWAVAAGERFRLGSPPGIRVTASRLEATTSTKFASAVQELIANSPRRSAV